MNIPPEVRDSPEAVRYAEIRQEWDAVCRRLYLHPDEATRQEFVRVKEVLKQAESALRRIITFPVCPLSERTADLLGRYFSNAEYTEAARILEQDCGFNLPGLEEDPATIDRLRWSVIQESAGNLHRLQELVSGAMHDWRYLLAMWPEDEES